MRRWERRLAGAVQDVGVSADRDVAMFKANVHVFLLAAVALGVVVSAVIIATLMYTMGMRGWGLGNEPSWPVKLVGGVWVLFIFFGGLFVSWLCGNTFGIEGASQAAQTARLWFILIWVSISTVSIFATVGLIGWRKQKRENASAKRDN